MTALRARCYDAPSTYGRRSRSLQLFASNPDFHAEELDGLLAEIGAQEGVVEQANLVGSSAVRKRFEELLLSDTPARERFGRILRMPDQARCIQYDIEHLCHGSALLGGSAEAEAQRYVSLHRTLSLTNLFKAHNGLVVPPRGYHYKKPSGLHAPSFLRTSNALESGIDVDFVAYWLLPYIHKHHVRRIIVDTSGISSVAISLAHMAVGLGLVERLPSIESHSSYGGLEGLQIRDPDRTLVLVSASTSGGLSKELIRKGANADLVVTLFRLGDGTVESGQILCDLKVGELNPDGLVPFSSFNEGDCPQCKTKSFPVRIEGDQFSLEPPTEHQLLYSKSDVPEIYTELIDRLAGTGFFKAYRSAQKREFEIFLDVSALFPSTPSGDEDLDAFLGDIRRQWNQLVLRGLPVHSVRIVHGSYPFSRELAEAAAAVFNSHSDREVEILDSRALRRSNATPSKATLVVAACLDDAHELMGISRDLRDVQPQGNITYIAPIFRGSSRIERDRIQSNLTFGELGATTFSLYRILDIELPRCATANSWAMELDFLRSARRWAERAGHEIPDEIGARIGILESAPATGLTNNLFWPSFSGRPLKVRSDFTLIKTEGGKRAISQADVFVVISVWLHRLREGVQGKPRLAYRAFERAVIAPDNFQRFNDGAIQAAILRAARAYELAYASCSIEVSNSLYELLNGTLDKVGQGEGEALPEFVLAIATRRLTLDPAVERNFLRSVEQHASAPKAITLIAKYLLETGS